MRNPRLKGFLLSLVLASAVAVVLLIRSYLTNSADVEQAKVSEIHELTNTAAAQIAARIGAAEEAAGFVASLLSGSPAPAPPRFAALPRCAAQAPTREQIEGCLEDILRESPDFYGGSITERPAPAPRSVYLYKSGPSTTLTRSTIPEEYATTADQAYRWYIDPMRTGRDGWSPPYYDDAGSVLMTTYSALFRVGNDVAGVVTIDISGDHLRAMVQDLELGPSGYGALSAADGSYLYHPNPEYVQGHRTILDVAREKGDEDRVRMWEAMLRGESGTIHHKSTLTGEQSWLLFVSVGDSGWHLQNTFIKSDINFDVDFLRHKLIETACAVGILLIALLIYGLHLDLSSERRWWWLSTGVSAVFLVEIGTIWALTLSHPPSIETELGHLSPYASQAQSGWSDACRNQQWMLQDGRAESRRLTEFGALRHMQAQYRQQSDCRKSLAPVFVEVGTSIENLKFLASNEVSLGGYLWQRIPAGAPAGLQPQFTIANAIDLSKQELDSRTHPDGSKVKRWRFEATVAQNRNSTRYPIERETVRIQFKHDESVILPDGAGRGHRVYLVPALQDYDVMTPSSKPGVDRSLVVPGWRPKQSYFELAAPSRGSNLGLGVSSAELVPPDLNFSIVFERDFADAFISNLTPIIVVAIMLFALLTVSAKMDYGRALSICMGMFFVIVFGHIDLRQRLAAQHIFYLEYFFFTIYAMILCVSFACLLQAFNTKIRWFEHRDRLFIKIAYWPILLGTLYGFTLASFY